MGHACASVHRYGYSSKRQQWMCDIASLSLGFVVAFFLPVLPQLLPSLNVFWLVYCRFNYKTCVLPKRNGFVHPV